MPLLLFVYNAAAALHVDGAGGFSMQSEYRYFEIQPDAAGTQWLTFNPINNFCASSRISIDVWKNKFRFGFYSGFIRRYELEIHSQLNNRNTSEKIGDVLSIPLIGFLEGRHQSFFYEFGLGPYITRFNYNASTLPEFSVSPLFGFLFGGGYNHQLMPGMSLLLKGEMLVNAPIFLVDHLTPRLKEQLHSSRYTEYNINDFQTIIFNATISLGIQYEFGSTISLPIDKMLKGISSTKGR